MTPPTPPNDDAATLADSTPTLRPGEYRPPTISCYLCGKPMPDYAAALLQLNIEQPHQWTHRSFRMHSACSQIAWNSLTAQLDLIRKLFIEQLDRNLPPPPSRPLPIDWPMTRPTVSEGH